MQQCKKGQVAALKSDTGTKHGAVTQTATKTAPTSTREVREKTNEASRNQHEAQSVELSRRGRPAGESTAPPRRLPEPIPDNPTEVTIRAVLASLTFRFIRRSTPFVNENCYRDGKGRLRCRHCDGPVRGPVGCRRCEDCGEDEEWHRVLEMMRESWPGAEGWNVVEQDHVEIFDSRDKVLAVITSDDLTRMWNDL
jgi:hypothetical protein